MTFITITGGITSCLKIFFLIHSRNFCFLVTRQQSNSFLFKLILLIFYLDHLVSSLYAGLCDESASSNLELAIQKFTFRRILRQSFVRKKSEFPKSCWLKQPCPPNVQNTSHFTHFLPSRGCCSRSVTCGLKSLVFATKSFFLTAHRLGEVNIKAPFWTWIAQHPLPSPNSQSRYWWARWVFPFSWQSVTVTTTWFTFSLVFSSQIPICVMKFQNKFS